MEIDQEALIVFNNGQIFGVYAGKKPMSCWVDEICGLGFAAVGSGAPYALAAMEWGASAYQAVVTACAFDPNSASPFYTLELNHPLEGVQTC